MKPKPGTRKNGIVDIVAAIIAVYHSGSPARSLVIALLLILMTSLLFRYL